MWGFSVRRREEGGTYGGGDEGGGEVAACGGGGGDDDGGWERGEEGAAMVRRGGGGVEGEARGEVGGRGGDDGDWDAEAVRFARGSVGTEMEKEGDARHVGFVSSPRREGEDDLVPHHKLPSDLLPRLRGYFCQLDCWRKRYPPTLRIRRLQPPASAV